MAFRSSGYPKSIVKAEVGYLEGLGVKVEKNFVVGRTATIDELMEEEGYDAVFVGSGARACPRSCTSGAKTASGSTPPTSTSTRSNLMRAFDDDAATPIMRGKRVVTVGGGNVAMDAARTALRLGAQHSIIVYRRSEAEMPARKAEIHRATKEGIEFRLQCNPTEILTDENGIVKGITCIRMELGTPDDSGRRRPVPLSGSEFVIDCEVVIVAIGNSPNPLIPEYDAGYRYGKRGRNRCR